MPFNHYVKIKRILANQPSGWIIKKINKPTVAKNFKGEIVKYPYYYRIYDTNDKPIKYCKFQKIDLLAKTLGKSVDELIVVE